MTQKTTVVVLSRRSRPSTSISEPGRDRLGTAVCTLSKGFGQRRIGERVAQGRNHYIMSALVATPQDVWSQEGRVDLRGQLTQHHSTKFTSADLRPSRVETGAGCGRGWTRYKAHASKVKYLGILVPSTLRRAGSLRPFLCQTRINPRGKEQTATDILLRILLGKCTPSTCTWYACTS